MLSICHVEELIEHVVMPPHWKFSTALPRSRRRGKGRTSRQPAAIAREFPSVTDFEREFPSLCFALATGVGKTRLMGAFISYLHLAHGFNNFFVLAPNLTIYNKLITDFTPNTPKYVFTGIAEFATEAPALITGDNYEGMAGTLLTNCISARSTYSISQKPARTFGRPTMPR
jgi:hypothetical protein